MRKSSSLSRSAGRREALPRPVVTAPRGRSAGRRPALGSVGHEAGHADLHRELDLLLAVQLHARCSCSSALICRVGLARPARPASSLMLELQPRPVAQRLQAPVGLQELLALAAGRPRRSTSRPRRSGSSARLSLPICLSCAVGRLQAVARVDRSASACQFHSFASSAPRFSSIISWTLRRRSCRHRLVVGRLVGLVEVAARRSRPRRTRRPAGCAANSAKLPAP